LYFRYEKTFVLPENVSDLEEECDNEGAEDGES
jgi:hypothetical protein